MVPSRLFIFRYSCYMFHVWICGRVFTDLSPRVHLHVMGMLRFTFFDIDRPSLPTPFYSVLVYVSVFMALSTIFHSTNSPGNSPLSHFVLLVFFRPYWSFQLYISCESLPQPWYNPLWLTGLKAPTNKLTLLIFPRGPAYSRLRSVHLAYSKFRLL